MAKYNKELAQERQEIFHDVFEGKVPKRVPISAWITVDFAIQYSGLNVYEAQWYPETLEKAFRKVTEDFYVDVLPVKDPIRFPSFYEILGARNFIMGSTGYIQHPEISVMDVSEYDQLAEAPWDFIIETLLPRLYKNLGKDPIARSLVMAKAFKAHCDTVGYISTVMLPALEQEYGKYQAPPGSFGMSAVPLDFIADQIRGFKAFCIDVRRVPDKIEKATEAILEIMLKKAIPPNPSIYNYTFMPLHMPPYMREKDFMRLYYPHLKKMVEEISAVGGKANLFLEHDWMRYLDQIFDLAENTMIRFEYGDPKLIKEKIGNKHIITGLYPVSVLKTGTKQECIDKAKELFDILAPGGRYIFDFDKNIITLDSVNVDNLKAVLEFVMNYGKY